jgi:GNAT superfamily N-acetyltransferase
MSASGNALRAPERLQPHHEISDFNSGVASLDDWLRRRARQNEGSGASRTYVVCLGNRVIGYYALAAGAAAHEAAPGRIKRNMPDPIPVMVIGRVAVDRQHQSQGVGRALLRDAILRTTQAAEIAGFRAILVHAISEEAKRFYERSGFLPSPLDPMTLMIPLSREWMGG